MRKANFNAGPAAMPLPVLEQIQHDLIDYQGKGLSVMEMSHRSDDFAAIAAAAEQDFRELLAVPEDYAVLFMQGGATAQFALSIDNLAVGAKVAYANTGYWSGKAMATAARGVAVHQACSLLEVPDAAGQPLLCIPEVGAWDIPDDADFLHVTDNETIDGIAFDGSVSSPVPLVADFSSSILSRPLDVSRYNLIYAGAQKNIGPAGITLVIVSPAMLERSASRTHLPDVFSYAAMAASGSMLNTPPTFAWYCAGLVFNWLKEQGGLAAMEQRNRHKAAQVYGVIDGLDLYCNRVHPRNRSWMNVPFSIEGGPEQLAMFLREAAKAGLLGLKGHKSVGGARASLYNGVDEASVARLLAFLTSDWHSAASEKLPARCHSFTEPP